MKNRCKSAEEAKAQHLLFVAAVYFNARNVHDKAISVGESNNTGSGGSPPEDNRSSGAEPSTLRHFTAFYAKYTHF